MVGTLDVSGSNRNPKSSFMNATSRQSDARDQTFNVPSLAWPKQFCQREMLDLCRNLPSNSANAWRRRHRLRDCKDSSLGVVQNVVRNIWCVPDADWNSVRGKRNRWRHREDGTPNPHRSTGPAQSRQRSHNRKPSKFKIPILAQTRDGVKSGWLGLHLHVSPCVSLTLLVRVKKTREKTSNLHHCQRKLMSVRGKKRAALHFRPQTAFLTPPLFKELFSRLPPKKLHFRPSSPQQTASFPPPPFKQLFVRLSPLPILQQCSFSLPLRAGPQAATEAEKAVEKLQGAKEKLFRERCKKSCLLGGRK